MRTYKFQWFCITLLLFAFSSQNASAGLFDDDQNNWRRIFEDIKKINARIVSLKINELKVLESTQLELSRQIEEIKSSIPILQGSVEHSQAKTSENFKTTNQRIVETSQNLADIETQIKMEIINNFNQQLAKLDQQISSQINQQKIANDKFQGNLAEKFNDLKSGMAADMENFAKLNKENYNNLARLNSDNFAKVVARMNIQRQSLDKVNEIIKSELIPTIIKQDEDLRMEMSQSSIALLASVTQAKKENRHALQEGLSGIEANNQKLREALLQNFKEGEAAREFLSKRMDTANGNAVLIHNDIVKLNDSMVQQMGTLSKGQQNLAFKGSTNAQKMDKQIEKVLRNFKVAEKNINKLAESLKVLHSNSQASRTDLASLQQNMAIVQKNNALNEEKLIKIITSSSELATHYRELAARNNEIGQSINQIVAHSGEVDQSLKNVDQAWQIVQGKFTEVITGQSEIKQSQNQIFKSQVELNQVQVKMSQAQAEMSQAQIQMGKNQGVINQTQLDEKQILEQMNLHQARILKAQEEIRNAQNQIIKAQEEIRNAQSQSLKTQADVKKNLADLSRKANVNISRNDAIRKTLATLGNTSSTLPPRKQYPPRKQ